jgi:glyoxylate utilization-related uncharacterized protein
MKKTRTSKVETAKQKTVAEKKELTDREIAELIVSRKDSLEDLMFKVFGKKLHLEATTHDNQYGRTSAIFYQECVQEGHELGLIGRSIYRVDIDIRFSKADDSIWLASISLRWHHVSGGSNGSDLGVVKFDASDEEYEFASGHKQGKFSLVRLNLR